MQQVIYIPLPVKTRPKTTIKIKILIINIKILTKYFKLIWLVLSIFILNWHSITLGAKYLGVG